MTELGREVAARDRKQPWLTRGPQQGTIKDKVEIATPHGKRCHTGWEAEALRVISWSHHGLVKAAVCTYSSRLEGQTVKQLWTDSLRTTTHGCLCNLQYRGTQEPCQE